MTRTAPASSSEEENSGRSTQQRKTFWSTFDQTVNAKRKEKQEAEKTPLPVTGVYFSRRTSYYKKEILNWLNMLLLLRRTDWQGKLSLHEVAISCFKGHHVQNPDSGSSFVVFSHKTPECQDWAMCCQSPPLLADPGVHSKYAAVEINVKPIVWQRCTEVSSFSARGLCLAKAPLL